MTAIVLLIVAAIPIHLMWLRKQRSAAFPPIGSRWIFGSYLSIYKVEVIEHHPFSGEITIARFRMNDTHGVRTSERINAQRFLKSARPCKEPMGKSGNGAKS